MAGVARRGGRPRRTEPGPVPDAQHAAAGPRTAASACRACAAPTTSTRSRRAAEPPFPGDEHIERRIRAYIRWNAAIMVHRAQRPGIGVGGHISTYASAASLYEVGFNHFFRGHDAAGGGDQIYFQGHASPGIYARAFLEGRLTERPARRVPPGDLARRPGGGLPSYPHPRLMPDFWEFPTVSMGLGADQRDLPGPVQPLPAQPRHQGHQPPAGVGVPRRRRDGRARGARRDRRRRPRRTGQPHLRRQLQPAAPRRPGPRQRQDHPGAGVVLPRRRLERHQGDLGPASGIRCWPPTPTARWST